MKTCAECNKSKDALEFPKRADISCGRLNICKICLSENNKAYLRTKKGVVTGIYGGQRSGSKKRGHLPPTYTKQELKEWLYSNPLFHILYDNWKRLDYQKRYKPSVDRKDDYIGYTMDNIQLMTWGENRTKGYKDKTEGRNNKNNKAVIQLTTDGEFIAEYHSTSEAGRQTEIKNCSISEVCRGNRKTAGGFVWGYK